MKGSLIAGLAVLVLFCANATKAQSPFDLKSSPRDVLYAQTRLLDALDVPWPPVPSPVNSGQPHRGAPVNFPEAAENEPPVTAASLIQPRDLHPPSSTIFDWRTASRQALLYTGIMHSFRFASEPGTRDALNGPLLKDYFNSVLALRGWSDGDTFVTNYIAHPMEGGIFSFIEQQNDPLYRNVQWGDGRRYWMGRLRTLAFAAVWSTQWKLGPLSEASLGNVQLHASAGMVDLVVTPSVGTLWAMGEDLLDKYALAGLEDLTANRTLIILARSFANPCRTFANLMAFQRPWYRPNRPGVFRDAFDLRSDYVRERRSGSLTEDYNYVTQWRSANHIDTGVDWQPRTGPLPSVADFELIAAVPHYESFLGGGSCIGGGGQGAVHMSPQFSLVAEVSGCRVVNMPQDESGDSLFYAIGPRWTPAADRRTSPYAQVLIGGRRVTHEIRYPDLEQRLLREWNDGNGILAHYPMRDQYTLEHQQNGFAIAAGGGVDVRLNRGLAWRVASLEYTHTWVSDVDMIHPQEGVRFTSGLVLRVGTW